MVSYFLHLQSCVIHTILVVRSVAGRFILFFCELMVMSGLRDILRCSSWVASLSSSQSFLRSLTMLASLGVLSDKMFHCTRVCSQIVLAG